VNKQKVSLQANAISVTLDNLHSNAMRFTGTCMFLNTPSDYTPNGVDRPVVLSSDEAEKCASTMNLMGINCDYDPWLFPDELMTAHNRRNKIGVVEKCWVDGDELKFTGIMYKNDFPDIADFIKKTVDSLGFSVEAMFNLHEHEDYIEMADVEFTGVAMLFKNAAAYQNTYIAEIAAKAAKGKQMEKHEIQNLIEETIKAQLEANAKAEQAKVEAQELATAKAEVERLTAECSAKDVTIAEKDAKIAELEKAVADKDAEIEASAKETTVVSDVKNLETKAKLEAGKKENFTDFADMVNSVL
jgi:hypothetical protein